MVRLPYRPGDDDVDIDETIAAYLQHQPFSNRDVVVRRRRHAPMAAVVMVDLSGSMEGDKWKTAASTIIGLSLWMRDQLDAFGVVAFWSDAAVLCPIDAPVSAATVVDRMLRIPARGLTNVHFALTVGAAELARANAERRVGILLSDCVHNAGPDPRAVARQFPSLSVLLQTSGEVDPMLAQGLARQTRGMVAPIATHRDVGPALARVLNL